MNLLFISEINSTRDLLIRKLFPQGINLYHSDSFDNASNLLSTIKIGIVIVDIDLNANQALSFLTTISKFPIKPVRIVMSSITDKEAIMHFVRTGIAGYIIKPFTEENGLLKILQIIKKVGSKDEQRTYYRVNPNPNEDKKVFFRLSNNAKLRTANIINISAGGLALNCNEEIPEEELNPGTYIPKVQLKLNSKEVFLSGDVIYRKESVFAIKLKNCTENDLYLLSKYIFDKISETL